MWSIEHLGPGVTVFAAASSRESEVRAKNATRKLPPIPKVKFPGADKLMMKMIKGMAVNPATGTSEMEAHAYELADGSYDQRKAAELAALFVEHTTWNCPTLIRVHTQQFGDSPEHTEDLRRRYMAPPWNCVPGTSPRRSSPSSPTPPATPCAATGTPSSG
ncbi:hypothetical protein GCM10020295_01060 [Streptomyces cinereospinus]